ncbi:MAG: hypothetical protein NVV70_02055 [Cellulomonas sp.]|uniref:hypothetical protein n=1 Tax=unclassified Cellulomonas TaxID=2620175 RepID=UPI0006528363|nr:MULTISPECIES: hypothetical protein [unclassified Cellulomonas]KMM46354.1 hypothetical protein CWIS_05430 [Cellulomonas sp. A375-1]MCR6646969.1 hypothetical protein [Cellulomonas sp.]MCR6706227.1 hypothetical protein [Cellulomonas sp.]
MSELWDIEAELTYRLQQAATDLRDARSRTRSGGRAAARRHGRSPGAAGPAGTTTSTVRRAFGGVTRGWSLRGSGAWSAAR